MCVCCCCISCTSSSTAGLVAKGDSQPPCLAGSRYTAEQYPTVLQVINASFIDLKNITAVDNPKLSRAVTRFHKRPATVLHILLHIYHTFAQPTGSPKDSPSPRKTALLRSTRRSGGGTALSRGVLSSSYALAGPRPLLGGGRPPSTPLTMHSAGGSCLDAGSATGSGGTTAFVRGYPPSQSFEVNLHAFMGAPCGRHQCQCPFCTWAMFISITLQHHILPEAMHCCLCMVFTHDARFGLCSRQPCCSATPDEPQQCNLLWYINVIGVSAEWPCCDHSWCLSCLKVRGIPRSGRTQQQRAYCASIA
jgi:hypothetical protein